MSYIETINKESEVLETLINEKFQEFTQKLHNVKPKNYNNRERFIEFCHELTQSYLYEFRRYVNSRIHPEETYIVKGLGYTSPINILNFNLQVLVSEKHKQFDTLYQQYLLDNL
jgi:hypothetical protein